MSLAELTKRYDTLRPKHKILTKILLAVGIYILDAWLLGSLSLIFRDMDMALQCLGNPFYAAVTVPRYGSWLMWIFLNLLTIFIVCMIVFNIWIRYPEVSQHILPGKLRITNDPTHGTSNWMTKEEADEHFSFGYGPGIILGRFEGNIIRHNNPFLNRNTIVFGPPGTGKTWSLVLPNILQSISCEESAIITDPKQELLRETLSLFQESGYAVRVFNLINMESSDRWNPITEVRSDLDAFLLSQIIMENTEGAQHRPLGPQFWERSEQNLLNALILYTAHEAKPEKRNLAGMYDFLTSGSFDELDATFRSLPPDHPARKPYNLFCMAKRDVQGNIIQGLGTRLKIFQNQAVRDLTSTSDIDLELPGRQKCAYFCVIPDTDRTFQFLSSLFFSFLFLRLTKQADRFGGENPLRVNFIMDEFCTIGVLPDFKDKIATMRSRGISCMMVTQSLPQMKERYPFDTWKEIVGCCSLRLVWGSAEMDTSKYISELLGNTTVEQFAYRRRSGIMDAAQITKSPTRRSLLDPAEVGRLPFEEGIAVVLGANPVRFKKMPYKEHPLAWKLEQTKKYIPLRERMDKEESVPEIKIETGPCTDETKSEGWEDSWDIQGGTEPEEGIDEPIEGLNIRNRSTGKTEEDIPDPPPVNEADVWGDWDWDMEENESIDYQEDSYDTEDDWTDWFSE